MSHERFQKLIDEMIVGELDATAWQELRVHIAGCKTCRSRYDRVALAERMLHGGPSALGTPSPVNLKRIGAAVLDGAGRPVPAWQRALQWFAPTQRWVAGVAAVAAMAVLIPFLVRSPASPKGEFQMRGVASPARTAGVRAFCIAAKGVSERCARDQQLRLTVSNAGKFQRVFVVGFDDEWSPKWYAPRPPDEQSVAAPAGVDVQIGPPVRIGVNHEVGKTRIFALFSDTPLTAAEVEAAAARAQQRSLKPSALDTLPLERKDVTQKSVVLDVEP
jgi:hypothetical protein